MVRIKGRRRDKGGEGGRSKGGRISPPNTLIEQYLVSIFPFLMSNTFEILLKNGIVKRK